MSSHLAIYHLVQLIQSNKYSYLIGSISNGRYYSSSIAPEVNRKSFDITLSNYSFSNHYSTKSSEYKYPFQNITLPTIITQYNEAPNPRDNSEYMDQRPSLSSSNPQLSTSSTSCAFQSYQVMPIFLRQFLEKSFFLRLFSSISSLASSSSSSSILSHIHVITINPLEKNISDYTFLNDIYTPTACKSSSSFSSIPFIQMIVTNFPLSASLKRKKRYISFTILFNTSHQTKSLQEFITEYKETLQYGPSSSSSEDQRESV